MPEKVFHPQSKKELIGVSRIVGSLSKAGLIKYFYRPKGFQEADRITEESRARGLRIGKLFENLATKNSIEFNNDEERLFASAWASWHKASDAAFIQVETAVYDYDALYWGRPDFVNVDVNGTVEIGDYKVKAHKADYQTRLAEEAYIRAYNKYAATNSNPFATRIRVVTFHPETAAVTQELFFPDDNIWEDFLTCNHMYYTNQNAEAYYHKMRHGG